MRCPPRLTLFPYTTLFRSVRGAITGFQGSLSHQPPRQVNGVVRPITFDILPIEVDPMNYAATILPDFDREMSNVIGRTTDRKSTRLNSSHVAISYAVFCLK